VVACALAAAALGPPAAAREVTSAELRRLAQRALTDPAAMRALRDVDRVDGRPYDLGASIADADREEAAARLRVLAGEEPAAGVPDAATARRAARDVLDDPDFRPSRLPRPLRGAISWLGDQIERVLGPVAERIPGARSTVWVVLGLLVLAITALVVARLAARRSQVAVEETQRRRRANRENPAELERRAAEAEGAGEFEAAVRLRFRAGLLRLDELGALPYRASLTTGQVARRLRLRSFEPVGASFDAIVYGGAPARPADAARAKDGWARVLVEAKPREAAWESRR
jgi:hypothetical protein